MLVGYYSVKYRIFDGTFQASDFPARLQIEYMHDFTSVHWRLEIADTVFLFKVFELLAYQLEVVEETLFACLVFLM